MVNAPRFKAGQEVFLSKNPNYVIKGIVIWPRMSEHGQYLVQITEHPNKEVVGQELRRYEAELSD